MNLREERQEKLARLRRLMAEAGVTVLWLRRISSFAWFTGGASDYVNIADEHGIASIIVTSDGAHIFTNNIEAPRLLGEEGLNEADLEWHISPWHEGADPLAFAPAGSVIGADEAYPGLRNLGPAISALRSQLLPPETERMRDLGRRCGLALSATMPQVTPGMTEMQIAGLLARETYAQGVIPLVNLVAADERVSQFRHPIPTEKKMQRYAMVVLSGRRHGLIASLTRLVHFGPLPKELRQRAEAVARVDAALIAATRPGARLADIFQIGVDAYAAAGYRKEWLHHHQGGTSGYEGREEKGRPAATGAVLEGQAYAWNPSIAGVKSEDTLVVGTGENEVITLTPNLPHLTVRIQDQVFLRPAIWER
jgi:antitoxin VapB